MIRRLRSTDAEALASLYVANRDALRPFEPERDAAFFTPQGQLERARQAEQGARAGRLFRFVIVGGDGAPVGLVSLENVVRAAAQSATLGYWVDVAHWGRGIATRAVAAACEEAFGQLGLHRLQAPTLVDNHASQRVLIKNGFELIGRARGYLRVGGAWRDHLLFERVAAEHPSAGVGDATV